MSAELTDRLAVMARALGAAVFGVSEASPFHDVRAELEDRRMSGRSGPLRFTFAHPDVSTDIERSFPWARSLVSVGYDYLPEVGGPGQTGALVGRFAALDHYQAVRSITSALVDHLRSVGHEAEALIDDNRLVDRAAAVRAGLGWAGKSTMVLAPGHGPWLLLGTVVTDAILEPTGPMRRDCGSCVACLPACPTGALDGSTLDARRCLATWLQTPGSIPQWIRPRLGRRIYGCDDCLLACPPGSRALASAGVGRDRLPFDELLALDDEALLRRFHWWYVPRRQGRFIRRNLLVAAGNSPEPGVFESIESHLGHPSSMIRGHAYWAIARGFSAGGLLRQAMEVETAPEARDELMLAELMVEHPETHRLILGADERARMDPMVRALALIGPLAEGRDDHTEATLVPVTSEADLARLVGVAMVRIYDPDRLLEMARGSAGKPSMPSTAERHSSSAVSPEPEASPLAAG